MKRWVKTMFLVGFSFLFCFLCIGYAQYSTTLVVSGGVEATPPKTVFITNIHVPSNVNATVNSYTQTVMNSTVTLGNNSSSTATLEITVFNNTGAIYYFDDVVYEVGANTYDNTYIKFALTGLQKEQEIAPQQYLTFQITFSYRGSAISNTKLNSVLNFHFVPDKDSISQMVVSGALDKFKEILNTDSDYTALIHQMDDPPSGRNDSSYIGNVVGATSSDSVFLNEMFADEKTGESMLTLELDGVKTNVTAMIKRENIDGNANTGDENGNEITLYMTTSDFKNLSWNSTVPVYAAVFTRLENSDEWIMLGEMYTGSASPNAYSGNFFAARDSFNTDTWKSTVAYYNGAAPSGSNIEKVISAIPKQ